MEDYGAESHQLGDSGTVLLPAGLDTEALLPGLLFPVNFAPPHELSKQTYSWETSVLRGLTCIMPGDVSCAAKGRGIKLQ